jgi:hypothetical protein
MRHAQPAAYVRLQPQHTHIKCVRGRAKEIRRGQARTPGCRPDGGGGGNWSRAEMPCHAPRDCAFQPMVDGITKCCGWMDGRGMWQHMPASFQTPWTQQCVAYRSSSRSSKRGGCCCCSISWWLLLSRVAPLLRLRFVRRQRVDRTVGSCFQFLVRVVLV